MFKTFECPRERKKIAVKARSDGDVQGDGSSRSKKRNVGDQSEKKREYNLSEIISDFNYEEILPLPRLPRICLDLALTFPTLLLRPGSRLMHADNRAMFARLRFVFLFHFVTTTQIT